MRLRMLRTLRTKRRLGIKITRFLAILILFASAVASTQSRELDSDRLLARVSYNVGPSVIDPEAQDYPQACFALYRGGYYQISREDGAEPLQGTLSRRQRSDLGKMLRSLDFKSSGGGLVERSAERFVAEVVRDDDPTYYVWMNPDHRNPLPSSAVRIVKWLQGFKAEGASPILTPRELSEHSICPPTSGSPLHSLTSELVLDGVRR
jgi:hypothetical protein